MLVLINKKTIYFKTIKPVIIYVIYTIDVDYFTDDSMLGSLPFNIKLIK